MPSRRHLWNICLLILAWVLFLVCLWQLEIVHIHLQLGWELIDLPFLVYRWRVNVWTYRDILYLGLFISMVLEFVSLRWWKD